MSEVECDIWAAAGYKSGSFDTMWCQFKLHNSQRVCYRKGSKVNFWRNSKGIFRWY
jgi:hypothetical protein